MFGLFVDLGAGKESTNVVRHKVDPNKHFWCDNLLTKHALSFPTGKADAREIPGIVYLRP